MTDRTEHGKPINKDGLRAIDGIAAVAGVGFNEVTKVLAAIQILVRLGYAPDDIVDWESTPSTRVDFGRASGGDRLHASRVIAVDSLMTCILESGVGDDLERRTALRRRYAEMSPNYQTESKTLPRTDAIGEAPTFRHYYVKGNQ